MQERRNSTANALGLHLSCSNRSTCPCQNYSLIESLIHIEVLKFQKHIAVNIIKMLIIKCICINLLQNCKINGKIYKGYIYIYNIIRKIHKLQIEGCVLNKNKERQQMIKMHITKSREIYIRSRCSILLWSTSDLFIHIFQTYSSLKGMGKWNWNDMDSMDHYCLLSLPT